MVNARDFRQNTLFDRVNEILSDSATLRLSEDWPGVFRNTFLEMIPIEDIGTEFSANFGRPTKEHYSICGLILLKEYFNWTTQDTIDNYLYNLKIHYALMIDPDNLKLGTRTLERYMKLFREKELAQKLMNKVSHKIISSLNIQVDKQRLDSTHVFSNMANWSRSMLLFKTTKRFLVQVKRHESKLYYELEEELRKLYDSQGNWLHEATMIRNIRYGKHVCTNKEQVAWDMSFLIQRFSSHEKLANMNSYKMLCRIFNEQCEVDDGKIKVRKHPGGEAIINPSDLDASVDQKGIGYQVQVCQTFNQDNCVQVITAALPQTASESDQNAINPVIEILEDNSAKPKEILADSGYGSDDNVMNLKEKEIELVAPVLGKNKAGFGLENFVFDENNKIIECPIGKTPMSKSFNGTKGYAVFSNSKCGKCPNLKKCSVCKYGKQNYKIEYDLKRLRLCDRAIYERSDEFKERYRFRNGIEALFGNLKQNTSLRRIRFRGEIAVYSSIYSILTMHNIMQMVHGLESLREKGKNRGNILQKMLFISHYLFKSTSRMSFEPELYKKTA